LIRAVNEFYRLFLRRGISDGNSNRRGIEAMKALKNPASKSDRNS